MLSFSELYHGIDCTDLFYTEFGLIQKLCNAKLFTHRTCAFQGVTLCQCSKVLNCVVFE